MCEGEGIGVCIVSKGALSFSPLLAIMTIKKKQVYILRKNKNKAKKKSRDLIKVSSVTVFF